MDLTIYDIIIRPRITEKAYALNKNLKQLVLQVHPKANKSLVVEALEKLFNVKVADVQIIVSKGKKKRIGRREFEEKTRKKAIISLKEGFSVDIAGISDVPGSIGESAP